ncbi:MAG: transposase [Burkholderiaceae bacterium]
MRGRPKPELVLSQSEREQLLALTMRRKTAQAMALRARVVLSCADGLERSVPPGLDVHLVMDNYGTHKVPSIKAWFARHLRFHVHFIPTSASWLNQVEQWFATLTEKYLRRGTHRSTRQLEEAIRRYLDSYNANPRPFVWSKSANDILASLERFCIRVQKVAV